MWYQSIELVIVITSYMGSRRVLCWSLSDQWLKMFDDMNRNR